MSDRFLPIPSGTSPEQMLAMINRNFAELDRQATNQLYKDENGIPSISIGVLPGGTTQIKVAKSGFDVTTCPDADLIFNSAQNVFKIVGSGTLSLTHDIGGSSNVITTTASEPHGLGFVPGLQAFITLDPGIMSGSLANSQVPNPYPIFYTIGADLVLMGQAEVYVDATNVYFTMRTDDVGGGPYSCSAKYYLTQETFA